MCPKTAKDIEKSANDYYCIEFLLLQIMGGFEFFKIIIIIYFFPDFSYSGDVWSILSTVLWC